jgi:hypothetical protein
MDFVQAARRLLHQVERRDIRIHGRQAVEQVQQQQEDARELIPVRSLMPMDVQ